VTIHARTLAELPSEGQSFEDLFKGKNNGDVKREDAQPDGTGTDWGSVKGSGSGAETPAQADAIAPNAKMSLLAKAAGAAVKGSGGGGGPPGGSPVDDDPEAFTWWLDVLSPTDEEMRMLSKVGQGDADES
jgi:magnesium transporter